MLNERYSGDLGDADALKVFEDVRDTVVESNEDLAAQASANSKDDFVRHRDDLLISAAGRSPVAGRSRPGCSRRCSTTTTSGRAPVRS